MGDGFKREADGASCRTMPHVDADILIGGGGLHGVAPGESSGPVNE
jgi:hypothetical protein